MSLPEVPYPYEQYLPAEQETQVPAGFEGYTIASPSFDEVATAQNQDKMTEIQSGPVNNATPASAEIPNHSRKVSSVSTPTGKGVMKEKVI